MRLRDFIAALYDAGWRDTSDGQHLGIKALHKQLFPVIAEMEDEAEDAQMAAREMMDKWD